MLHIYYILSRDSYMRSISLSQFHSEEIKILRGYLPGPRATGVGGMCTQITELKILTTLIYFLDNIIYTNKNHVTHFWELQFLNLQIMSPSHVKEKI